MRHPTSTTASGDLELPVRPVGRRDRTKVARGASVALCLAAGLSLMGPGSAARAADSTTEYTVKIYTGGVLSARGGAEVFHESQHPSGSLPRQLWTFSEPGEPGKWMLRNAATGTCLAHSATAMYLAPCEPRGYQLWTLSPLQGGLTTDGVFIPQPPRTGSPAGDMTMLRGVGRTLELQVDVLRPGVGSPPTLVRPEVPPLIFPPSEKP